MPRGYTIVRPDETADDVEKEAARRLGIQGFSNLRRAEPSLPKPGTTHLFLTYQPLSVPQGADIILNPTRAEPPKGLVMGTCRVPNGKKIAVYVQGVKTEEVEGGGLFAVRVDVPETDTVVSFEGSRAGGFEWGWYFKDWEREEEIRAS